MGIWISVPPVGGFPGVFFYLIGAEADNKRLRVSGKNGSVTVDR